MSISAATLDNKYVAKAKLRTAELALEANTLVSNPATVAAADAAISAAVLALTDVGGAVATGSTTLIAKSTVKFLAPATTGSYVNGYTLTIVNGAVTAIVAS